MSQTASVHTVFFCRMLSSDEDAEVTAGKNYSIVSTPLSDFILNDLNIYVPMPCTSHKVFGMVKVSSIYEIHDPAFKNAICKAREDFCAAMQKYYN